ncbi:SWIM zinc finger family protein [Crassaminicella profunda]|uniref:SWIM zinc finger family protein n=1 Tax=Crassaminicella profunda TaxID=1286698 RepID=UPI001CA79F9A|nr:SWIM zinc finger family protein [Crassaminicella profunda]QZY56179.1 hypothetical protein K7H06_04080 [Crassaminicella profunda]
MDRSNHFIKSFKDFILSCDETYLIDAANKGLYKRALKEIDKENTVEVEIKEDKVICKLEDETVCELTDHIGKYKCSCPSRNICKHVLISIIYIQRNINEIFRENSESDIKKTDRQIKVLEEKILEKKDFSWILNYDLHEIKKRITKKEFSDILFRVKFGIEVEIKEENFLVVYLKDWDIRVRFTENPSLDRIICTCKEKDFCIHKAEAMIHYKLYKKHIHMNEIYESIDIKICKEALQEVRKLISEITIIGLSRLPENILKRIENTAVFCHSKDLVRLEKLLRSLKSQLELYFHKHASFSKEAVRKLITRIYNISIGIEKAPSNRVKKNLIGEHKTSYTEIPPVTLCGMGAGAWKSNSGYAGITYYFFNEKRKLWMTYIAMKPTYYEGVGINIVTMYKSKAPWNMENSMENISKDKIQLKHCKVNKNYRISSSEETIGNMIEKTNINKIDCGNILYEDWRVLIKNIQKHFHYKLLEEEENINLVLLKVYRWGKSSFDSINQVFKLPIYDKNNQIICILLKFNTDNKGLINRLESMEKYKKFGDILLGKIYRFEGNYVIDPITMYYENGEMINLTLE